MNKKFSVKHTVIIFDWDDTIFPTSWFTSNNIATDPHIYRNYFNKLDDIAKNMLSVAQRYGRVVFCTNALLSWIDMTTTFLPKTKKLNIPFISARELYQKTHPIDSWKVLAFKKHLGITNNTNNIISVGDALYEYNALVELYKNKTAYLKVVKFIDRPSFDEVAEQNKKLEAILKNICVSYKHIDMKFEKI